MILTYASRLSRSIKTNPIIAPVLANEPNRCEPNSLQERDNTTTTTNNNNNIMNILLMISSNCIMTMMIIIDIIIDL